jgi:hypothetical protein
MPQGLIDRMWNHSEGGTSFPNQVCISLQLTRVTFHRPFARSGRGADPLRLGLAVTS